MNECASCLGLYDEDIDPETGAVTGFSVLMKNAVFGCILTVWINVMETMCAVNVKLCLLNVLNVIPVFDKYVIFDY